MRHPFRRFERYHQRRTRRQNFANSSQKLKFTADDTSFVNDGITLAYYMSLAGEAAAKSPHPAGRLAKVKLLPSNAESKTKAPIEPNKELPDGVKNILLLMSDKNGAQVADVEELSKKLGKLAATSMNFATVAGSEKASGPEDLTESQWARILANNRALRGYYLNGASGIMRKAPKGVCQSAEGQVFFMLESGNALIDAASFLILLHDLSLMLDGGEPSGPSRRYKEYILYLGKTLSSKGLLYWKKVLSGAQPCLFPQLHQRSSTSDGIGRVHTLKRFIPNPETFHSFCRLNRQTATNIFQLGWALVLRRYTGHTDTVGPFFNVLPCRLRVELDIPPLELLRPNQAAMHSRLENQNCSLLDIIRCTGLELDGLLNTCLTVQPALSSSFSTQSEQTDGGLELQEYDDPTEFAICCAVLASPGALEVDLRYSDTICTMEDAVKISDHFIDAVHRIVLCTEDTITQLCRAC
ncbi:hypothetical protein CNMCM7927_006544 [Aspergillus lentulus]|nr:hypothetical protein CNMCM7927_006544 [Aspergillus lentulus]